MDPVFYDRKGAKCIQIKNGKSLFNERIAITSPNGKYCAVAGYWYVNDDNSENDGDEIDGSAEAIILEDDHIAYRVKGIDALDDDSIIRDDGKLCMIGDDSVSMWSASANPIKKKFAFSWIDCGINADFAWAYGDGDDGNIRLSVFIFETGKMWTKRLSTNINGIKKVILVKDPNIFEQRNVIAIAETYDDEDVVIKYDTEGKKQDPTKAEIAEIAKLQAMLKAESAEESQTGENAENGDASRQKKKIPRWVTIFAIVLVIVILALIGKNLQP